MSAAHRILVETTRGHPGDGVEHTENQHAGSVAVVDCNGRLVASAGDPHFVAFTRSTIKPFQALPFVLDGGPGHFGFGPREIAVMCSSHSGEPTHVGTVSAMLDAAGLHAGALRCGCQVPLRFAASGETPAPGASFSVLEHNCSGKHTGFLAWCALHERPQATYLDPGHPLQRAIRERLAQACEVPVGVMHSGIDGCSAPNHAIPLASLALGYARLAAGEQGPGPLAPALGQISQAMLAYPDYVSGTGRADLQIAQTVPGDWIAKAGADGVQAIGLRSAGLGIALKIADGNPRAAVCAAIGVLDALGVLDDRQREALTTLARPAIRNTAGVQTGEVRSVVLLEAG
jgi:L-asparaginase II